MSYKVIIIFILMVYKLKVILIFIKRSQFVYCTNKALLIFINYLINIYKYIKKMKSCLFLLLIHNVSKKSLILTILTSITKK